MTVQSRYEKTKQLNDTLSSRKSLLPGWQSRKKKQAVTPGSADDLLTGEDLPFSTTELKFLQKPGDDCYCSTFKVWLFFSIWTNTLPWLPSSMTGSVLETYSGSDFLLFKYSLQVK